MLDDMENDGSDHDAVEGNGECDEGKVDVVISRPPPGGKDEDKTNRR